MLYCIALKKKKFSWLTVVLSVHTELKQTEEVIHNTVLFLAVPHAVQAT